MPTINLHKKEKRIYRAKKNNTNHKIYNTSTWRKLRLQYLSEHPLCERCLEKGILIPSRDVHHKYEIDNVDDINEKKAIGYDYNNLEALCEECHIEHHRNKKLKLE